MYAPVKSFEDFPVATLIPCLEAAVVAANEGLQYREVRRVEGTDMYVALKHEGDVPVGIEIGQDHASLLEAETMEHLKSLPGLTVNHSEPWYVIALEKQK